MEGYSLDKWRNASKEDLPPDEKAQLDKYDALLEEGSKRLKALDESLESGDIGTARHTAASLLELLSTIRYFSGKGYREHTKLKEAYANTKEGQEMLAHQEASNIDQRYDTLVDNAEDARQKYEQSLAKLKEFAAENLQKDEQRVVADLEKRKDLPRRTPRDDGPSLKEQLKRLIP